MSNGQDTDHVGADPRVVAGLRKENEWLKAEVSGLIGRLGTALYALRMAKDFEANIIAVGGIERVLTDSERQRLVRVRAARDRVLEGGKPA